MQLTLELITKGFVSSFEEEEYEFTKIFYNEEDLDTDEGDEIRPTRKTGLMMREKYLMMRIPCL